MKTMLIAAGFLLFYGGCLTHHDDQLTEGEKNQIKSEVKTIVDSVWAKLCRLDSKGTLQYMWDSPEVCGYGSDGSRTDYQTLKGMISVMMDSASAFGMTTMHEDYPLVTENAVVYVWSGTSYVTNKKGATMTFNPDAETFLFRKIDGRWKIAFVHESGTMVAQKSGKK